MFFYPDIRLTVTAENYCLSDSLIVFVAMHIWLYGWGKGVGLSCMSYFSWISWS